MKKVQQTLNFPSLNKTTINSSKQISEISLQSKLQRKRSYECILAESQFDESKIPKVIIRRKSSLIDEKNVTITVNKENVEEISFTQFLNSISSEETVTTTEKLKPLKNERNTKIVSDFNKPQNKEIFNNDKKTDEKCQNKAGDKQNRKNKNNTPLNKKKNSLKKNGKNDSQFQFYENKSYQNNKIINKDTDFIENMEQENSFLYFTKDNNDDVHIDVNKISHEDILIIKENIIQNLHTLSPHSGVNYTDIYNNHLLKVDQSSMKCWNELYAPNSTDNFLTENYNEVSKLKKWLSEWKMIRNKDRPIKKTKYSSDSDFDYYDEDNNNKTLASICVIVGQSGVGKTSLVYAIAKELDYTVLEMNCSSRRTGKDVFSKFDQSMENKEVRIQKMFTKSSITSTKKTKLRKDENELNIESKKIPLSNKRKNSTQLVINDSVLFLFDDFDIVMDEDAGFWGSIYNLIEKKKRPIILTCSDGKEAQKFLNKFSKVTNLTVSLKLKRSDIIVSYLQTILLSRNQISEYEEILNWLKSLKNTDLRSAINNLHFDSILSGINYRKTIQFNDWSKLKSSNFLKNEEFNDLEHNSTEIPDSVNCNNLNMIILKKVLRKLLLFTSTLSFYDSYVIKSQKDVKKVIEKYSNTDRVVDSTFNTLQYTSEDISNEFIKLYNSYQDKAFESSDFMFESLHNHSKVNVQHKPQIRLNNLRVVVTGRSDRLDRVSALRIMSTSESKRKNDLSHRRFTHYFDRNNLGISKSDQILLSTPFNK